MAESVSKHILIVDDEKSILHILRNIFIDTPHRLSLVETGQEAKTILEDDGCDLLLTDKNLPDISGLELLRIAKQIDPTVEVIIITGYDSTETVIEALEHDVYAYLLKSEAMDNIYAVRNKVDNALAKQQVIREKQELMNELVTRNEELYQALDEAKTLQAELVQSQKLAGIGTVAAGIAHEISSPLQGILSLSEAITDETDLSTAQGYANEIIEYCHNIRSIISGLSSYTRSNSNNNNFEAVVLGQSFQAAVTLLERSLLLDHVQIKSSIDDSVKIMAQCNEIQQIFVNLIKNGSEAIRDRYGQSLEGRITVNICQEVDTVLCTIEDNGTGILNDNIDLIFDPFFTTKSVGAGTGLGLNIVYRLVHKYRGTIHVESVPQLYTRFLLRFPNYQ